MYRVHVNTLTANDFPYDIQIVAEHLDVPWAIDLSEDGRIYFTERSGKVRVIENGILNPQPLLTLRSPFISRGECGLMGIALDPEFLQNHFIYIMHSYTSGTQILNRVVRLLENNNVAEIDQILLDGIPGGPLHNGGRIKVGPDNKLYITTGDTNNPESAQDLTSLGGKILRIELDGSSPVHNPIMNSPIYCLGNRDPQGIAWNARNVLYESEHGAAALDEINIIKPGANYGWPLVQGEEEHSGFSFQKPILNSGQTTWAPSGMAFVNSGQWEGKLLVACLFGQELLSITLNNGGSGVEKVENWLWYEYGRLRDVVQAKDGSIYVTTSNRDGRGNPSDTDDRILRLVPKQ